MIDRLPRILIVAAAVLLLALPARGQDGGALRIVRGDGTPATLGDLVAALDTATVLFIGETHDDSAGHVIERRLLEAAYARRGADVVLSLEMFERDVQPVLDEYLAGLITEEHALAALRPWTNYADYRPLVEFARAHDLPILAANAPRRYVNRVARLGPAALAELTPTARAHLAPLPHPGPSEAYRAKWAALAHGSHGTDASPEAGEDEAAAPTHGAAHGAMPAMAHLFAAQTLWDATMAHTIATHLLRDPEALVVHVAGAFHVESGAGTPDVLARYRPGTEAVIVVLRPDADFDPEVHAGLGDFVVLTR